MPNHKVGTREEWSAARKALLEREQELGKVDEELAKRFLLASLYSQLRLARGTRDRHCPAVGSRTRRTDASDVRVGRCFRRIQMTDKTSTTSNPAPPAKREVGRCRLAPSGAGTAVARATRKVRRSTVSTGAALSLTTRRLPSWSIRRRSCHRSVPAAIPSRSMQCADRATVSRACTKGVAPAPS